jgi:hypothetical protein
MRVGSQRQLRVRLQSQLSEYVFVIHQVVEWESRIDARSRQYLEECVVRVIRRIAVTSAAEIACAKPGLDLIRDLAAELVARFDGDRPGAMPQSPPIAELARAPDQRIHLARPGFERRNVMAADSRHSNLIDVGGA